MRLPLIVLLPAGLLACAAPQPSYAPPPLSAAENFRKDEDWLNRANACGAAPYADVARLERRVRSYAETHTLMTKDNLLDQAAGIARNMTAPSPAGCVNARNQWRGLLALYSGVPETQFGGSPIPPRSLPNSPSTNVAGGSFTPPVAAGRFREFEDDVVLVTESVACRILEVKLATQLVTTMAEYWVTRAPGTPRDAFVQRASDMVAGSRGMARPDCQLTAVRLLRTIKVYRARLLGAPRPATKPATPQPLPRFQFKEPEVQPNAPAPSGVPKVSPEDITDL